MHTSSAHPMSRKRRSCTTLRKSSKFCPTDTIERNARVSTIGSSDNDPTKVPLPCSTLTIFNASSLLTASRTEERDVFIISQSSVSVGSESPGCNRLRTIYALIVSIASSQRLRWEARVAIAGVRSSAATRDRNTKDGGTV